MAMVAIALGSQRSLSPLRADRLLLPSVRVHRRPFRLQLLNEVQNGFRLTEQIEVFFRLTTNISRFKYVPRFRAPCIKSRSLVCQSFDSLRRTPSLEGNG